MLNYKLRNISPSSKEALKITDDLFIDLEQRYGKGTIEDFMKENKSFRPFLIIEINKKIIACGTLNKIDEETAEIKRMFVYPKFRGKGFSKIILQELEKFAVREKYKKIILETGVMQPEAISLYKKFNYKKRKCYGKYENDPHSVCFEKKNLIRINLI